MRSRRHRRTLLAYGVAVLVTAATLLLYLACAPWIGDRQVLMVFLVPAILSAHVGGLGPGLASTLVAAVGTDYFILPPRLSLAFATGNDLFRWAMMTVISLLGCILSEGLHRARRRAEASERLYATTLASIGDAVISTDVRGRITFLNAEAERLTGWRSHEAAGQPLASVFCVVDEHGFALGEDPASQVLRHGATGGSAEHTVLVDRAGNAVAIDASAAPIRYPDGSVQGVVLVFRDCSERRQAEIALRERMALQQQLAKIAEYAAESIFLLDAEGCVDFANPEAERTFGHTAAELRGQRLHERIHHHRPDGRPLPVTECPLHEVYASGTVTRDHEDVFFHKDGSAVAVSCSYAPLESDGRIAGAVLIVRDISERRRAEEHELRSHKLEALGTLAGGIAHDFNNILMAIAGNTKLAAGGLVEDHPAQQSLAEIAKASKRAADLVRRILAFSRPQDRKLEVVTLEPVVEEAVRLLRASIPARIEVRASYAADVPAVVADTGDVHQIVLNLATNAVHAIGERRGLIDIHLERADLSADAAAASQLRAGCYTRLSVTDDGCGMDPATRSRIFDPFFTTKGAEGTGLGLSVVHGIMRSYEGAVTISSELGRGAIFCLYFPAAAAAAQDASVECAAVVRGRGQHVLYVDDDNALVFLATRILKDLGYEATGYTDPARALQEFRARPRDFAAVITDVSMPAMSGFDVARELHAVRPDVPVVLTSGYVRPEDEELASRVGIRAVIAKPDSVDAFGTVLDQVLRANGAMRGS